MAASIKIDPLTGDNYDTWKIQMRAILKKNDLWEYVTGTLPQPGRSDSKHAEWIKNDGKAESDILLAVSPSELIALDGLETSKAIWDKLKSLYQSSGPARKASLLKKLVLTRMQEEDDLKKHISDFFDAVKKLKEIGLVVIDELLAILLLYSLPDSFAMFRTAMESRDDLPSTEALKVKIVEDFDGRKSKVVDQGAMFVRRTNTNANQKNNLNTNQGYNNKSKIECYRCGRRGHLARECKAKNINKKQNAKHFERDSDPKTTMLMSTTEEVMFGDQRNPIWCIDSGCTGHMCNDKHIIQGFMRLDSELNLANNESTQIAGAGKVSISVDTGSEERRIDIEKVFYVSDLRTNLLSVAKMTDRGFEVHFKKNCAVVIDEKNKIHMRADRVGNLYHVRMSQNGANNAEVAKKPIDMWHERLGHLNERDLKAMSKSALVHGLSFKDSEKLSECEICISEKQTCTPFPKGNADRTSELLEIVHTDVCGPMRQQSFGGKKYFVTFIDDNSRWCEVYFIANKSDVLRVFKEYKAYVEKFTGKKIKNLQSDNGREYVNNEFDDFLKKEGIKRRLTAPYTPQQNGISERKNRTLIEMARCMMRQAGSPPAFWAEAVHTANYIRNRCPTTALSGQIPFTLWKGKKPTVIYMHSFGSKAYYKDKGSQKGKFDSSSELGIFMGYDIQSKAYRIHDPKTRKIIVTRDVKFMNETAFRHEYKEILDEEDSINGEMVVDLNMPNENNEEKKKAPLKARRDGGKMRKSFENIYEPDEERNRGVTLRKRTATVAWERLVEPLKKRGRLVRTGFVERPRLDYRSVNEYIATDTEPESESEESDEQLTAGIATIEPMTWSEIEKTSDADAWRGALEDEFLAQMKNGTWEIVSRPSNRKVIGSKFVFSTKTTGKKVRLVAKGCSQRPGEDFHETSSPVVRSSSIRLIAAISAELGLDIHQMDVVTAYLNGSLDEEVFMEVPDQLRNVLDMVLANQKIGTQRKTIRDKKIIDTAKRWNKVLNECDNSVCLLKKSLYGLRQSGLQWHKELVRKLKSIGFKAMPQDPCVFAARKGERMMFITIYVDDLILATNDDVWLCDVKKQLSSAFEMKDMGRIKHCLGIEFTRDEEDRVYLNQSIYIDKVLERFGMSECKPTMTPIDVNVKLEKPKCVKNDVMNQYPYQNLIGALMYLAVTTRPDITYAVSYLSQFNTNFDVEHWKAAKRVLRYIKGTSDYGLVYERTGLPLFGVVDADWGSNAIDRKSYSGFAFILAGAPISWEARKQQSIALSSTEAEYMAISDATKEAMYLRDVLGNVGMECNSVTLFNDNQGAIKLAGSRNYHSRTKHIDVRHHFVRDMCEQGVIDLKYLCTERMPADVLTKGLSGKKHQECMLNLGMTDVCKG